jgi:predicted Abi (CAAX) family protease
MSGGRQGAQMLSLGRVHERNPAKVLAGMDASRAAEYLRTNLVEGFRASPLRAPLKAWAFVPFYAALSLAVGFSSGMFRVELIPAKLMPILLITLLVFPSLLEEAFFRGVLIPRKTSERGVARSILVIGWSTLLFVLWHPFNALTINRSAAPIFLDPAFLLIAAALGITCGYGYVASKSLWVPVLIHWAAVVVWVFFLGGRNLILEL